MKAVGPSIGRRTTLFGALSCTFRTRNHASRPPEKSENSCRSEEFGNPCNAAPREKTRRAGARRRAFAPLGTMS